MKLKVRERDVQRAVLQFLALSRRKRDEDTEIH